MGKPTKITSVGLVFIKWGKQVGRRIEFAAIYCCAGLMMDFKMSTHKIRMRVRLDNTNYFGLVFFGKMVICRRIPGGIDQYDFIPAFAQYRVAVMGEVLVFKLFYFHVFLFLINVFNGMIPAFARFTSNLPFSGSSHCNFCHSAPKSSQQFLPALSSYLIGERIWSKRVLA